MLFNSLAYGIFLPIVFILYWAVAHKYRWIILLASSYYFYMCSGPKYGLLILSITAVTFFSALWINKNNDDSRKKRTILAITVLICLGVLFVFKYFNFFSSSLNSLLGFVGINNDPIIINLVLPVGISFYTFQTMSYVIDVYRGETEAEHHFGKYAAFVSFFPQLVAGPIERSSNLLPQIKKEHYFDYEQAKYGMKLMLWGYYKKLVIADVLSEYVNKVYSNPHKFQGFSLVLASLFFTIQIYCDFSGYSDIAIGTAKLFGINLMKNFDSPYFSKSVREFWGRWHISLSTWFRDYVYIPLGGNRVPPLRHKINLMITFLISGLWHGANWTYVTWGGVHGLAQVIETSLFKKKDTTKNPIVNILRMLITFCFCSFAWIFFVSKSMSDALYVISNCMTGIASPISYLHDGFAAIGLGKEVLAITGVCILLLIIYDWISLKKSFIEWLSEKKKVTQWIVYLMIALLIIFLSKKGVAAEFIYFQF